MEELEEFLRSIYPKDISCLIRDPRIDSVINDCILKHELQVNGKSVWTFLAETDSGCSSVFPGMARAVANSQKPDLLLAYMAIRAKSFLEDVRKLKSDLLSDSRIFPCYFEDVNCFIDGADPQPMDPLFYSGLITNFQEQIEKLFGKLIETGEILLDRISKMEVSTSVQMPPQKIKTNLSVGEISLLFRLLLENKTVLTDNKEELFRTIQTVFESSRQDNISVNSLRKKFHDPESNAISDVDAFLVNLRQLLRNFK